MANTYVLIASNTLTSSAASVTFSSIPNTYTDLVLKYSARATGGSTRYILARLNSDSSTLYSDTYLYTTQVPGVASGRESNVDYAYTLSYLSGSTSTADTFGNGELYFPSYTASQNKPFSAFGVAENNSSTATNMGISANLYRSTTAISSITLSLNSDDFASNSSFFLYGVKNT